MGLKAGRCVTRNGSVGAYADVSGGAGTKRVCRQVYSVAAERFARPVAYFRRACLNWLITKSGHQAARANAQRRTGEKAESNSAR